MSVLGVIASCAAGALGGAIGASMGSKTWHGGPDAGACYDDSWLIEAVNDVGRSVDRLNRTIGRAVADLELEAKVSLDDYNACKVHEAAMADIRSVGNTLMYLARRSMVSAMRCSGHAHVKDEFRFASPERLPYVDMDKLLTYGEPNCVRDILEQLYVYRLIVESVEQAPKFCETTHWDGKGASVTLRGKKAERYLTQKYVILNIQDLMPLVMQCKVDLALAPRRRYNWHSDGSEGFEYDDDDDYCRLERVPLPEYFTRKRKCGYVVYDFPRVFAPSPAKHAELKFLHVLGGYALNYEGLKWFGKYGEDGESFELSQETVKSMFGSGTGVNKLENV